MYQSPINPNFIIPDLLKYECYDCHAEFILSDGYDNFKAVCPYCRSEKIGATVAMVDPGQLDDLGCLAILLDKECRFTNEYLKMMTQVIGMSANKAPGKKEAEKAEGIKWHEDQIKTNQEITEAEKLDVFSASETPDAARQAIESGEIRIANREIPTPAPSIDLSAWEPVEYVSRQQIAEPYLHLSARGDGVIRNTELKPGSRVQFRIDPEGRRIAVIPGVEGQLLFREKNKCSRFSGGYLARTLQAKGIELPANFKLEWNDTVGAYIGTLIEKSEGVA